MKFPFSSDHRTERTCSPVCVNVTWHWEVWDVDGW